jgi:hypothetical protein
MENDRLIDIEEAAELLCTSKDFLYHNHQKSSKTTLYGEALC